VRRCGACANKCNRHIATSFAAAAAAAAAQLWHSIMQPHMFMLFRVQHSRMITSPAVKHMRCPMHLSCA
jgi:hypothetical protein